jgi:hypothetical protein
VPEKKDDASEIMPSSAVERVIQCLLLAGMLQFLTITAWKTYIDKLVNTISQLPNKNTPEDLLNVKYSSNKLFMKKTTIRVLIESHTQPRSSGQLTR